MIVETEPQPSAKLCICVINVEGEIVGSWTGDLYDIEGELNLLKEFVDTPGVKFQEFVSESPGNARRAFPELFLPWRRTTLQEEQKEFEWRSERIVSLEERLQGASGR